MTKLYLLLLVACLFIVAYIPRLFPMLYFTHRKVPSWFSDWMKYVPVALFAALAFKDVFITHEHLDIAWNIKIAAMILSSRRGLQNTFDGVVSFDRTCVCLFTVYALNCFILKTEIAT